MNRKIATQGITTGLLALATLLLSLSLAACAADAKKAVPNNTDHFTLSIDGGAPIAKDEAPASNPFGYDPFVFAHVQGTTLKVVFLYGAVVGLTGFDSVDGYLELRVDLPSTTQGVPVNFLGLNQAHSGFNLTFVGTTDGSPTGGEMYGTHDNLGNLIGSGTVTFTALGSSPKPGDRVALDYNITMSNAIPVNRTLAGSILATVDATDPLGSGGSITKLIVNDPAISGQVWLGSETRYFFDAIGGNAYTVTVVSSGPPGLGDVSVLVCDVEPCTTPNVSNYVNGVAGIGTETAPISAVITGPMYIWVQGITDADYTIGVTGP